MKIVNIIGGLGNQMFQYSFALFLKEYFPEDAIYLDIQHFHYLFFKRIGAINLHNGYEISRIFPKADLPIATKEQIRKVALYLPNYYLSRLVRRLLPKKKSEYIEETNYQFSPTVLEQHDSCYFEGYWQCVQYVEKVLPRVREVFRFPVPNEYNTQMKNRILNCDSVGIHIRRGDYQNNHEYTGICDLMYYRKAIDFIGSVGKSYFIFSNDISWCKTVLPNLLPNNEIIYVTENTGKDSSWDMYLMSNCNHLIIANSSFSWWGAVLNTSAHHVVAPKKWINREIKNADIFFKTWFLI